MAYISGDYSIGNLQSESELDEWFDFVASVFVSTGRKYFENHFYNDPARTLKGIFVARRNDTKKIVGTVRVFHRVMLFNGQEIATAGLGEVSTDPEFRGRGIAKMLINEAEKYMEENNLLVCSLHSSGASPMYAKLGWIAVPLQLSNITVPFQQQQQQQQASNNLIVQRIDFDDFPNLAKAMAAMYAEFNRALQLDGPFVRSSEEYWNKWVRTESTATDQHRNRVNETFAVFEQGTDDNALLLGYMMVRNIESIVANDKADGSKITVVAEAKEFIVSKQEHEHDGGFRVFNSIAQHIAAAAAASSSSAQQQQQQRPFAICIKGMPQPVASQLVLPTTAGVSVEDYWNVQENVMYKVVCPNLLFPNEDNDQNLATKAFDTARLRDIMVASNRHVFWKTDSF